MKNEGLFSDKLVPILGGVAGFRVWGVVFFSMV